MGKSGPGLPFDLRLELMDARNRRGWPHADLAEKLGVTVQTTRAWEAGRSRPPLWTMRKLIWVLRASKELRAKVSAHYKTLGRWAGGK